jgi:hypothetical protein
MVNFFLRLATAFISLVAYRFSGDTAMQKCIKERNAKGFFVFFKMKLFVG